MVDVPSPIFDWTDKPKQKAFFMDRKSPTIGGGGGYNSGKSYAMIGKIHMALETFAGSRAIIGRKTYSALEKSVVPTYQDIVWRRNGGSWNGPTVKKFTDLTAHYANGSTLWFTTFDEVTKVRGPNIAYAGISQAEEVAYEFFTEETGGGPVSVVSGEGIAGQQPFPGRPRLPPVRHPHAARRRAPRPRQAHRPEPHGRRDGCAAHRALHHQGRLTRSFHQLTPRHTAA